MKRYLYLLTSFSVLMSVSMGVNVSAEEMNTENATIATESTMISTEDTQVISETQSLTETTTTGETNSVE
ncbi:hypothetical protein [Enterococcus mundtii]|uniref:hypothetical protein n=1 Tax=Enterococcus mundtii TaxID=53346 RepID=UPI000CF0F318|nr:hypothetical protein [Enterococcus mundtii]PQC31330.1 hypothetical protein CUM97_06405 [Enterococcus mundtii]